jgi:hypothetical protein
MFLRKHIQSSDRLLSDLLYYRTSFDCHIRCRGAHSEGLWRGRMTGSGRISMNVESGSLWEGDAMATVPGDTITKSLMRYFGDHRGGHSPWHPCPRFSFILVPQFQTIVWEKPQWNSYFSKIDIFFSKKNTTSCPPVMKCPEILHVLLEEGLTWHRRLPATVICCQVPMGKNILRNVNAAWVSWIAISLPQCSHFWT